MVRRVGRGRRHSPGEASPAVESTYSRVGLGNRRWLGRRATEVRGSCLVSLRFLLAIDRFGDVGRQRGTVVLGPIGKELGLRIPGRTGRSMVATRGDAPLCRSVVHGWCR